MVNHCDKGFKIKQHFILVHSFQIPPKSGKGKSPTFVLSTKIVKKAYESCMKSLLFYN